MLSKSGASNGELLLNYNFQQEQYTHLMSYIDGVLQTSCSYLLNNIVIEKDELEQVLRVFNNNIYKPHYMYFLTRYIMSKGEFEGIMDFIGWLGLYRYYGFRKTFKSELVVDIEGYFNTIVIPKLWNNDPNKYNRLYNLAPNYLDQEKLIKKAWDHLLEGGNLILLNKRDYGKIVNNIGDFDEIGDKIFQKRIIPKEDTKTNKFNLWL